MPLPVINGSSDDIQTIDYPFHDKGPELPPTPIIIPFNIRNLIFLGALILLIIALIGKK